jgi:Tol biopolymer transport system component
MAPPAEKTKSFYDERPGKGFVIGAGKPFTATFENEKHFAEVRQLTFGGDNAEAYFSPDGRKLIYQTTSGGLKCDQEFILDLTTGRTTMVSTGKGRTTCGYFDYPEADRIVYASTHEASPECPKAPDMSQGYVWAVYDSFDLYEAGTDGSNPRKLTNSPGYDAEATWCHRGGKMVFTSVRDGDLDLYEMSESGEVRRLTNTPGYDGGAFYSPDCSEIVWRASRPQGADLDGYRRLLSQALVRPSALELFVMKSDGSNVRQVTSNGAANFGPYFHPDGNRIIFSSNVGASPREFDLWMVDKKGGAPERITTAPGFDGFPMWSPDGEYLVWASNRSNPAGRETNLFIARWIE